MSDKPVTNNSQTKFMNSEVEVFCDNSQTFSSVGTNYLLIEELAYQLGHTEGINDQAILDLMKPSAEYIDLISDTLSDILKEDITIQGKKGDRVYNAPKAFYNKSK